MTDDESAVIPDPSSFHAIESTRNFSCVVALASSQISWFVVVSSLVYFEAASLFGPFLVNFVAEKKTLKSDG